jgi:hypothetical protein
MVKETLVGIDVEWGRQILDLLDAAKFPVPVALWVRRGEAGRLRLMLATPLYDRLGPGKAYGKLVDTLWSNDLDWVDSPLQLQSTRTPWFASCGGLQKGFPTWRGETWAGR